MGLTYDPTGGNGSGTSQDANYVKIQLLQQALAYLFAIATTSGASATDLAAVEALLTTANSLQTTANATAADINTVINHSNWTSIAGNSVDIAYYAGVAAGNPSGTVTNIETLTYKTGATAIFTRTLAYNAADLIISVTTT